jgi:glycosyltransferase involved in cell wall biosynthesis
VKLPWRSYFLGRKIVKYKPAILHFHEMQHGAYIYNYLVGYRKISSRTKTIISTWGSDLTLYSWVDSHRAQIQTSLRWAKVLTAEKTDEITDASRLGFKGEFKAPVYIHLGRKPRLQTDFSIPSKRNRIFLKGYQGTPGRALNGLAAILKVRDLLENFEILVFSASEAVEVQLDLMRNKNGINIKTVSGNHKEMQSLFHTARVSVGLSISDGLPAAFIESLYAGCFPIQSENSAISKFISNGKNGFLVDAWDLDAIEKALRISLTDDTLVDSAVEFNRIVLNKEYDLDVGLRKLRSLYD